ncbi:MAG TPA: hypothetical protein PL110_15540 [Candidatus Eremiobacteraeota bacterium]|nr:MAG: hypothetical protein BWY64_03760 [bacterium ADurb.Bin363]HPZ09517.1 hypothetical protein [Candidatus Eremiobacteraeota bacterium]
MKKIILFIILILSFPLCTNQILGETGYVENEHMESHTHNEKDILHEKDHHIHTDACGEDCGHEGHKHNHSSAPSDSCGVGKYHDRYLMESVSEQPWRHPDKLWKGMWLMNIVPIVSLVLLTLGLRPVINDLLKKAVR